MGEFVGPSHDPICYEYVPPKVFVKGFEGEIVTPSGHTVVCSTTDAMVDIYDPSAIVNPGHPADEPDDHTYRFTAALDRAPSGFRLNMYVRNRNPLSEMPQWRHPAIRPGCLALRALDYFAAYSRVVREFEGNWTPLRNGRPVAADNWEQYQQNLKDTARRWRRPTAAETKAAAWNTPTGRLAARLGFNELLYVSELPNGTIQPLFIRSDAAARAHCDAHLSPSAQANGHEGNPVGR